MVQTVLRSSCRNTDTFFYGLINVNIEKMNLLGQTHGYKNIQQNTDNLRTAIDSAFEMATDGLNEIYDRIDRHFGITCFSKKSDIALMWSHYADKHKGFVKEYDLQI